MKRLFAVAMLLVPMLCGAADDSSALGTPSLTPVNRFVMQASLRFIVCRSSMRGVRLGLEPGAECNLKGAGSLADIYEATLRSFDGNPPAQSMTKDYYALWIASMGALMPSGERETVWESRTDKMLFNLNATGNRLKLEK